MTWRSIAAVHRTADPPFRPEGTPWTCAPFFADVVADVVFFADVVSAAAGRLPLT
jgi:hypothetical protein